MQGLRPFFRYFEFSGRSGRAEFWQYIAYIFIASMLLSLLEFRAIAESAALGTPKMPIWSSIVGLLTFIPSTAVVFRRLHDRNKSGWLAGGFYIFIAVGFLLSLVLGGAFGTTVMPLIISFGIVALIVDVYIIVQLALPGDEFENDYGYPDNAPFDLREKFGAPASPRPAPAARPVRAAPAPHGQEDALVRIERLAELHSKGHLTDEEFAGQKAKLLQGLA